MEKIPLFGTTPKDGKPLFENPELAAEFFRAYEHWIVYIEEYKEEKTKRQLGYWHTAFVKTVQEKEKELGNIYSHHAIHWRLKKECPMLQRAVINESSGEIEGIEIRSFADLTKKELSEVMEFIFQYASETYGIVIPEPFR